MCVFCIIYMHLYVYSCFFKVCQQGNSRHRDKREESIITNVIHHRASRYYTRVIRTLPHCNVTRMLSHCKRVRLTMSQRCAYRHCHIVICHRAMSEVTLSNRHPPTKKPSLSVSDLPSTLRSAPAFSPASI